MKIKLLINIEIVRINGFFRFKSSKPVIYPANKCYNANNLFKHLEQDKFHAQFLRGLIQKFVDTAIF